jgi:queuine tRNA-ribosyltransferase
MQNTFTVIHKDKETKARAGVFSSAHGEFITPQFMPVGTQGTVKAITQRDLLEIDAQIILGNTYHLYLRPGMEVISNFGGLHKFMKWDKPILTDSGGYQVFSLKDLRKLKPEGVEFRSHIDGSKHFFSPEGVVDIQRTIGSDIMMVLDECTPYPADYITAKISVELTADWAKRSKARFEEVRHDNQNEQSLFGICQGSVYPDLRRQSAEGLMEVGFDGYAIGGLSVGEPAEDMYKMTEVVTELLPEDKPRYLMGVGTPENILESIERGIDMFDCVMPTRNARNGQLFTTKGKINLRNAKYKYSDEPLDETINTYASRNFSLGYLRHLFISSEILGLMLATQHNIGFYNWLIRTAREKILSGEFRQWKLFILNAIKREDDK